MLVHIHLTSPLLHRKDVRSAVGLGLISWPIRHIPHSHIVSYVYRVCS